MIRVYRKICKYNSHLIFFGNITSFETTTQKLKFQSTNMSSSVLPLENYIRLTYFFLSKDAATVENNTNLKIFCLSDLNTLNNLYNILSQFRFIILFLFLWTFEFIKKRKENWDLIEIIEKEVRDIYFYRVITYFRVLCVNSSEVSVSVRRRKILFSPLLAT